MAIPIRIDVSILAPKAAATAHRSECCGRDSNPSADATDGTWDTDRLPRKLSPSVGYGAEITVHSYWWVLTFMGPLSAGGTADLGRR